MKATFENTVDILVKAYLNDSLDASDCNRCAVGNIISQGDGKYDFYKHLDSWYGALGLNTAYPSFINPNHPDIIQTGYTADELIQIESAFMYRNDPENYPEDNFARLMKVVDVLTDIHNIDLKQKEAAKLLFVKA